MFRSVGSAPPLDHISRLTTVFLVSTTSSHMVTADITGVEQGDRMTVGLTPTTVAATSTVTNSVLPVTGEVSTTNHLRSKKRSGGGSAHFVNIGTSSSNNGAGCGDGYIDYRLLNIVISDRRGDTRGWIIEHTVGKKDGCQQKTLSYMIVFFAAVRSGVSWRVYKDGCSFEGVRDLCDSRNV